MPGMTLDAEFILEIWKLPSSLVFHSAHSSPFPDLPLLSLHGAWVMKAWPVSQVWGIPQQVTISIFYYGLMLWQILNAQTLVSAHLVALALAAGGEGVGYEELDFETCWRPSKVQNHFLFFHTLCRSSSSLSKPFLLFQCLNFLME